MRSRVLALAAVTMLLAGCPNEKPLVASYRVGGTVSGLLGGGLVLQNNLSDTVEVNQDGAFAFPEELSKGTNYEVTVRDQPTMPAQTCTVENGAGTVFAEVTDVRVTCTTASYAVGGLVTGLVGAGLVLVDDASGEELAVAAGAERYAFHFASGTHYSLSVKTKPLKPAQTCHLFNPEGTVGSADVEDIPLTCTTDRFPVGGGVVGLAGVGLVVQSGSGVELSVEKSATSYAFELESGVAYAIAIKAQPANPQQTCVVDNANGVVDNAKVDDATITCTTDAFSVGGPITGLVGSGLVLTNNGGSDLVIAKDQTSYAFVLTNGAAYDIQVKTQPTGPRQTCVVANGKGTVGAADATDVEVTCVTDAYAVGGPISGLVGSGLVLQNNGAGDLAVAANATTYSFLVPSGATYALTIKAQPTNPSQTCAIVNSTGTMAAAPVTDAAISCATNTYSVGGTISGLVGTGLVLQNNLSGDLAVAKGATGYAFDKVPSGSDYAITIKSQPTGPEQTCVVSKPTGKVVASNVADANITCTTRTFSVGGPVTGLTGNGLVLQDGLGHEVSVASGASGFHFTLESGVTYSISVKTQPTNPVQTCSVKGGYGTVLKSDVTSVAVECGTNKFTVGGSISGLQGAGLVLQNGAGNEYSVVKGATSYEFLVASGVAYNVTVKQQPTDPSQTCTVANGSGTVAAANVTNATVTCTTNSYTVGGTITGYAGSGLVLQNNLAGDKTIPSGATSYSFTVASGAAYSITVKTQPTGPVQKCIVSSPSGTVTSGPVGNVHITCDTNKFLVGGTITGLAGSGLILQNGVGNEQTIASDQTTYSFFVASGSSYGITVKTQPGNPSQTCTVTNGTGTVAGADVSNVNVTCTTKSFTVGGAINGYDGSGLVLRNNLGSDQTVAKGAKSYSFSVLSGAPYSISVRDQPADPYQTCTVANFEGTLGGANVANANITCTTNKYDVGGPITGLEGTGLILKESVSNTSKPIAPTDKSYAFSLASGSSYSIGFQAQPINPSQTCSVTSASGSVAGIDISSAAVDCKTNLYWLGGDVSGLVGPSQVTLSNGSDSVTVSNGHFTFPKKVLSGADYAVTATAPANHACTVTGGSGKMGGADVGNVTVTCAWNTVIMLAGTAGSTGHFAAQFQDNASGGAWSAATNLSGATDTGTSLAITGNGVGIGLVKNSGDGRIRYTTWDGAAWAQLADTGATLATRSRPSVATASGRADAQAVFQGASTDDYKHYFMTWNGLGWTFGGGVGSPQAVGPNPPFILMRGADATVAFIQNASNKPTTIDRVSSAWQGEVAVANEEASFQPILHPVALKLATGADVMVIWHAPAPSCTPPNNGDCGKGFPLRFATRTGATWSPAADVQYTWTKEPFAAAALPNGDVIVAVHRSDSGMDRLWTSLYSATTKAWSNPRDTTWTLIGGPAITRGMGSAVAELAFIGTDYKAYHCRILDSAGTCPSTFPVGSGVNFVSIATVP